MMSDISRLPKWAQKHIADLQRERDTAITALNNFVDNQTESEIYTEDMLCVGESVGPSIKRKYINDVRTVTFEHAGIELDVNIYNQDHIRLSFSSMDSLGRDIGFLPIASNVMVLKTKGNMS